MKRALWIGLVLVLIALVAPATAGELLKFKNGHRLVAQKTWVDGDILYVQLDDGSVLGFPKDLVENEGTTNARYIPLGTSNRVTRGRRGPGLISSVGQQDQKSIAEGKLTADEASRGRARQVGYSMPAGRDGGPSSRIRPKPGIDVRQGRAQALGEGTSRDTVGGPPGTSDDQAGVPKARIREAKDRKETGGPGK